MGTIDSKDGKGYTLNKRSLLELRTMEGVKPQRNSTDNKSYQIAKDLYQKSSSEYEQQEITVARSCKDKQLELLERQMTLQYSKYPYSAIGITSCYLDDKKVIGSGCLIGPNYVLTSAHNVWSFKDRKFGKNITFVIMFNSLPENNAYAARKVYLSEELLLGDFFPEELLLQDYAVIELQCENIQQKFGSLPLQSNFNLSQNDSLGIIGYNFHEKSVALQKLSCIMVEEYNLFKYNTPTSKGMSGGPIINIIDGVTQVVGIHLFSHQKNGQVKSGGIKLNTQMLKNIQKWCIVQQEEIDLSEKGIGKQALKHISKRKWNNLVSLNLSRNGLQSNSAKYLKRGNWRNLLNFSLGGNLIGMEGARALAQSELSAIVTLNLWGNCIGKGGAYSISMANWENLTNLNLYNNQISDQGVEYLSQANWKNLNNLNLGKNEITIHGARFILEGKWPKLTSLNLWGNDLSCQETLLKSHLLQKFCVLKFLQFGRLFILDHKNAS